MFNYKHLHYFHVVAVQGMVARAAEQLHVTAQAISMQMQLLEDQLGEQLFQKKGRLRELTEAGKTVRYGVPAVHASSRAVRHIGLGRRCGLPIARPLFHFYNVTN